MTVTGLWPEIQAITPGKEASLATLGAAFFTNNGRPLCIAVDTPLAIFELKAAGGMNHVTRTFYYQALHMLAAGVHPLFVFDGPNKPLEKGAAEAECVALEKALIVDGVLTRDGDAFVFGGKRIMQKIKADNTVVMVQQYLMDDLRPQPQKPGLRRQDLFLLAMMSGGDYDDGIRGCGPKIAIEAARAGYAGRLWALVEHGTAESLIKWGRELQDELRRNHRTKFSQRWVAVAQAIENSSFPDQRIAKLYTKPTVSANLGELSIDWDQDVSVNCLREWTRSYFDWKHAHLSGKFVRTLAFPLLVKKLVAHVSKQTDGSDLIVSITRAKGDVGDGDGQASNRQLRVAFKAANIVDVDISDEEVVPGYEANSKTVFDPSTILTEWLPQWVVEKGAPTAFRQWEATAAKKGPAKAGKRKASASGPSAQEAVLKRPRGRPPKSKLATGASPAVPQPPSVAEPRALDILDDSDEFPDVAELVRTRAFRTTTAHRPSPSRTIEAPAQARQAHVVDLTSD